MRAPSPVNNGPAGDRDLTHRFAGAMAATGAPWPAAVALSGGGDSLALMFLLRDWARARGLPVPVALIVDHALREGSRAEALKAARWAKAAGVSAHILTRRGKAPAADIEAAAREARYRLLGDFIRKHELKAVYVAHNADDQAETFILRLARGSGVDGLAAMSAVSPWPVAGFNGLVLIRPLLGFTRAELRQLLTGRGQDWIEDPMNQDPRFARVRVRQTWPMLAALGLDKARILDTAAHLARARAALEAVAAALEAEACRPAENGLLVDAALLAAAPAELALRVLAAALMAVSGQAYRPRFARLERLYNALLGGALKGGRTLHGCKIAPAPRTTAGGLKGMVLIRREPGRRKSKKNKAKYARAAKTGF
jgi:tRNA(Ile)-lysidine synthase